MASEPAKHSHPEPPYARASPPVAAQHHTVICSGQKLSKVLRLAILLTTHPKVVIAIDYFVTCLGQGLDSTPTEPGLDHNVFAQSHVPLGNHLLPDERSHASISNLAVSVIDKFLQKRRQNLSLVGAHIRIKSGIVVVELVSTEMEVRAVLGNTREEVIEESVEKVINIRAVHAERTTGWLLAPPLIRLLIVRDNEILVSKLNDTNMTGHVNLHNDLDSTMDTILIYTSKVLGRIGQSFAVRALFGQLGQGWDLERPGLRVSDVKVKTIQLAPRHGIDRALDVLDFKKATGYVEKNTSVRVLWLVLDRDRRVWCVPGSARAVLEEKLDKGLKSVQDTCRGLGLNGSLALFRKRKGVRLVNLAIERLEGAFVILLGLGNL
ncbi:hypothetical protein HG531_013371 [Fusarium graminearum]|nr:hypothetical protein HG531_013371 [Fusarium graminearum]